MATRPPALIVIEDDISDVQHDISRLKVARAEIVIDPATDTVTIRFAHDGDSFDAVQRALDLLEDAEAGSRMLEANRKGARATNDAKTTAAANRARRVRQTAIYYRQAYDGDERRVMCELVRRFGPGTEMNLSERTIRRYLEEK